MDSREMLERMARAHFCMDGSDNKRMQSALCELVGWANVEYEADGTMCCDLDITEAVLAITELEIE